VAGLTETLLSPKLISFLTLLAAVGVNILGETTMKHGMNQVGELHLGAEGLLKTFTNVYVVLGLAIMFAAAVLWLRVISREPLSWAYPMLALGYIPLLLTTHQVLGESISPARWLGVIVIIIGVALVARS
jgi:multidrug transporter EmrE-like cation transporter